MVNTDLWIAYAAALIWTLVALPQVKISQFYPVVVGLNIVVTSGAAIFFVEELVTPGRIVGIAVLLLGVFLVAQS